MTVANVPFPFVIPMTAADTAGQAHILAAVARGIEAFSQASRAAAHRTWSILLVMGENKARYRRSP